MQLSRVAQKPVTTRDFPESRRFAHSTTSEYAKKCCTRRRYINFYCKWSDFHQFQSKTFEWSRNAPDWLIPMSLFGVLRASHDLTRQKSIPTTESRHWSLSFCCLLRWKKNAHSWHFRFSLISVLCAQENILIAVCFGFDTRLVLLSALLMQSSD